MTEDLSHKIESQPMPSHDVLKLLRLPTMHERYQTMSLDNLASILQTVPGIEASNLERFVDRDEEKLRLTQTFHHPDDAGPYGLPEALSQLNILTFNSQGLPESIQIKYKATNPQSEYLEILPDDIEGTFMWQQYQQYVDRGTLVEEPFMGITQITFQTVAENKQPIKLWENTYSRNIITKGEFLPDDPGTKITVYTEEIAAAKNQWGDEPGTQEGKSGVNAILSPGFYPVLGQQLDNTKVAAALVNIDDLTANLFTTKRINIIDGREELLAYTVMSGNIGSYRLTLDEKHHIIKYLKSVNPISAFAGDFYADAQGERPIRVEYAYDGNTPVQTIAHEFRPVSALITYAAENIRQTQEPLKPIDEETFIRQVLHPVNFPRVSETRRQRIMRRYEKQDNGTVRFTEVDMTPDGEKLIMTIEDSIPDENKIVGTIFTRRLVNVIGRPSLFFGQPTTDTYVFRLQVVERQGKPAIEVLDGEIQEICRAPQAA